MSCIEENQLLPQESVIGYLFRRNICEGRRIEPLVSAFAGRYPELLKPLIGWRVVPKITSANSKHVQRFSMGCGESLGFHHTIAPIYQPLIGPDIIPAMGRLFEKPGRVASYYRSKATRTIRTRPTYARIQYCRQCFQEQIAEFGTPYIRRDWTIPFVRNCAKHEVPLSRFRCDDCGGKEKPSDLNRMLEQYCRHCASNLWRPDDSPAPEESMRVDRWLSDMLRRPLPYLNRRSREICICMAKERLERTPVYLDARHKCTNECDERSCIERLNWFLDKTHRLDPRSAAHTMRMEHGSRGSSPFLLFWIPIIHAYGKLSNFEACLIENKLDVHGPLDTPAFGGRFRSQN